MNEETMDLVLEQAWDAEGSVETDRESEASAELWDGEFETEEGEAGADNTEPAPAEPEQPAEQSAPVPEEPETPRREQTPPKRDMVREHPSMQQVRESARKRDLARFIAAYPGVRAADVPRQVWDQVAKGVPMVSAYAMYENTRLRAQVAAERQNRANLKRTPGGLGSNSGPELDELDRMWAEDD